MAQREGVAGDPPSDVAHRPGWAPGGGCRDRDRAASGARRIDDHTALRPSLPAAVRQNRTQVRTTTTVTASGGRAYARERHPRADVLGRARSVAGQCLGQFERPCGNVRTAVRRISPVSGPRVLDFACGAGVLSAWLAASGARVTGIDISPIARPGRRAAGRALSGCRPTFTGQPLKDLPSESFDALVGEYALHHVDLDVIAPQLRRVLKPGGVGAFVETMALNPLLNFARAQLCGTGSRGALRLRRRAAAQHR